MELNTFNVFTHNVRRERQQRSEACGCTLNFITNSLNFVTNSGKGGSVPRPVAVHSTLSQIHSTLSRTQGKAAAFRGLWLYGSHSACAHAPGETYYSVK